MKAATPSFLPVVDISMWSAMSAGPVNQKVHGISSVREFRPRSKGPLQVVFRRDL